MLSPIRKNRTRSTTRVQRAAKSGRKAPVPATCDSVEALLRHELLAHLPDWLSRKSGVLGCTGSPTLLFMCWKEIFPNEDATRFDLVDELYTLPAKLPTGMFQIAAWLEDWMTELVAAHEVSAHIEPRRAMAVPHECWESSPDRRCLHDRVGGDLPPEWTQGRCDCCQPPGCMSQT